MFRIILPSQDIMIATIFFIIVALINKIFYDRKNLKYETSNNLPIRSLKSFRYFHQILRLSTIVICIMTIWHDSPNWMQLFSGTEYIYAGITVTGISMVIFLIATINLGSNYSPCYDSYLPEDIIQNGLYRLVRHPIYTANLMLMLGVFLSCGSILILINFSILFVYYLVSAVSEEKALLKHFPAYHEYKKHTGMFLPLLWNLKN